MSPVISLATPAELDALLAKHPQVLVNFSAAWSEPAKQTDEVFAELAGADATGAAWCRCEAEEASDISARCGVSMVPTLLVLRGAEGNEVGRVEGSDVGKWVSAASGAPPPADPAAGELKLAFSAGVYGA